MAGVVPPTAINVTKSEFLISASVHVKFFSLLVREERTLQSFLRA